MTEYASAVHGGPHVLSRRGQNLKNNSIVAGVYGSFVFVSLFLIHLVGMCTSPEWVLHNAAGILPLSIFLGIRAMLTASVAVVPKNTRLLGAILLAGSVPLSYIWFLFFLTGMIC